MLLDGFLATQTQHPLGPLQRDLRWLNTRFPGRWGFIAHGSDVRDPRRHMAETPGSYFASAPRDWVEAASTRAFANRNLATTSGRPLFVSTPDLLFDLPSATWLPLVVKAENMGEAWSHESWSGRRVKVLHIPSRAKPPIKGTGHIAPVLEEFERRGFITWLREPQASNRDMRELMRTADVVVDQIGTGSYGVTTVEGWLSHSLVLGQLDARITEHVSVAPPVIQTDGRTFRRALQDTLDMTPQQRTDLIKRGLDYASLYHSGAHSAAVLRDFLGQ